MASFDTDIVNYTEEQIREKAIKVLSDLNPNYFRTESLELLEILV